MQCIVHLVFDFNRFAKAEVVVPFLKRVEVDVFVVLDERSARSIDILSHFRSCASASECSIVVRFDMCSERFAHYHFILI